MGLETRLETETKSQDSITGERISVLEKESSTGSTLFSA